MGEKSQLVANKYELGVGDIDREEKDHGIDFMSFIETNSKGLTYFVMYVFYNIKYSWKQVNHWLRHHKHLSSRDFSLNVKGQKIGKTQWYINATNTKFPIVMEFYS